MNATPIGLYQISRKGRSDECKLLGKGGLGGIYIMQATAHGARDHLKELSILTIVNVTLSGAASHRDLNLSSNHSFRC